MDDSNTCYNHGFKRKFDDVGSSYGTGTAVNLPSSVSTWTLKNLTDIGLYYSRTGFSSPVELLNSVPQVCKHISDKCEEKIDYLTRNLDFELEIATKGLFDKPERRVDIAERLIKMLQLNLDRLDNEDAEMSNKGYEYSNMYTSARYFIFQVKDYIIREFYHQASYKQFFTDMMKKFGEMFSFLSESGASIKRVLEIGGCTVVSYPDIRFRLTNNSLDLRKSDWIETMVTVAEIKELKNNAASRNMCKTAKSTSLSFVSSTFETQNQSDEEFNICDYLSDEVLGRHGGELLVEFKNAETCPHIIGIIVIGSKVIVTSLKLTDTMYRDIIENGKLTGSDAVSINYCKPLDMFVPEDRKILYEVFFRLSKTCC